MATKQTAAPFTKFIADTYGTPDAVLAEFWPRCVAEAENHGVIIPARPAPIADGVPVQCKRTDGTKGRASFYVELDDGVDVQLPTVTVHRFNSSAHIKLREFAWQAFEHARATGERPAPLTDARRVELERAAAERNAESAAQAAKLAADAADGERIARDLAARIWADARPLRAPSDHPYADRKHIDQRAGLRIATSRVRGRVYSKGNQTWDDSKIVVQAGDLLAPMHDAATGDLINLQRWTDGASKPLFIPGGQTRGAVMRIGGDGQAVLVEGVATGFAVHMATVDPVVCAFSSGNLATAASLLGSAVRAVFADHDANQAGELAAQATGLPYCMRTTLGDAWDAWDSGEDLQNLLRSAAVSPAEPVNDNNTPAVQAIIAQAVNATDDLCDDIHEMPLIQSWPNESHQKKPLNTIPNLRWLLDHYRIGVQYDVIRKQIEVDIPGQRRGDTKLNTAIGTISSLCCLNQLPKAELPAYLGAIANDNQVNKVWDCITSAPWDGVDRLPALVGSLTLADGYPAHTAALLLRRWLISAVAAVDTERQAQFFSKGVLTLQGPQSIGKTSWFRSLIPAQIRSAFQDGITLDPDSKDSVLLYIGNWICELGELDGTFKRSEIAALKAFLTQTTDRVRRPYAVTEDSYPRRTVPCASVNDDKFLQDNTGNTRFWTIAVQDIDYAHGIDTQQLWAQVLTLYRSGERWWLDRSEEALLNAVNQTHEAIDPTEALLLNCLGDRDSSFTRKMTPTEVLRMCGNVRPTRAELNAAGRVLARLYGKGTLVKRGTVFDVPASRDDSGPF